MQLELNFVSKNELGKVIDPQPPKHTDCVERYYQIGVFDFFEGNEVEGHTNVMTIEAPDINMEPYFDWDLGFWYWGKVSEGLSYTREWWKDRI